jgi:hypothetical protein
MAFRLPIIFELEKTFSPAEIEALRNELAYKENLPTLLVHPSDFAVPALQEMGKIFNPEYRKLPCKISSYDIGMLLNKCVSLIEGNHVELRYQFPEMGKLIAKSNLQNEDQLRTVVDMAVEMQTLPNLSFIYDTANWKNPVSFSIGNRLVHRSITEFLVPVSRESVVNETKKGFKLIPEGVENLKKIIADGILHWNKLGSKQKDRVILGM